MKLLDEKGIGTVWSICKEKFALVGHTHNYAGSGSPGGSANSAIGVVDYNQTGKTIQIGYSGTGITGDQIKYIAGYTDGSGNVNAKIKDVSKDALKSWLGLGSLAYSSSSIPTKLSQLNNDKGFVTGSVSGNTVTINGASTTWTNTWRGIQDNLISSSTSDSLSANQGRVLKGLIDSKADSSDLSSYAHKSDAVKNISSIINKNLTGYGEQILKITYASNSLGKVKISNASNNSNGFMSISDKQKLDGIASGANNYSLPIATMGTLGGIRASSTYSKNDGLWPIVVDGSAAAHTHIAGLYKNNNGSIANITIKDNHGSVAYGPTTMSVYDTQNDLKGVLNIPKKFGTLALLSDIQDVSNLCKFNFVSSISDCVNGRINFLFKNSNDYVDLSFLRNLEEGTISLIYSPFVEFQITDKGSVWYYNGRSVASEDTAYISKAKLVLAFFKDIYVYVCTFS